MSDVARMVTRYGAGAPKCPRCNKVVYMAEEVLAVGKKFHKACFKCTTCNKALDSTKLVDKDNEIYCKSCYKRNFGPKGYGYGGGAGTLSMDGAISSPIRSDTESAPTTPIAKSAESFQSKLPESAATHNIARTPGSEPGRQPDIVPATTTSMTADRPTEKLSQPPASPVAITPTKRLPPNTCPACLKVVYMAEKVMGAGFSWHKSCFKCTLCSRCLDSTSLRERGDDIYCKTCYAKSFGPKGYGYGQGAGTLMYTQ